MTPFWRRLGTPDAINWVSVVAVWFLAGSGPYLSAGVDYRGRVGEFTAIIAIALLSSMPVLAFGKLGLTFIDGRHWAPWFTLVIFELTLVVRVLVFDGLLVNWGLTEGPELVWRLASTHSTMVFGLLAAAYVVTAAREFSQSNAQLAANVQLLEELRSNAAGRVQQQRARLVERIRDELDSALRFSSNASAATTSVQLQHAIDDVVRPLSLQLRSGLDSAPHTQAVSERIRWGEVFSATMFGSPLHPVIFGAWVMVASFGTWVLQFQGWAAPISVALGTAAGGTAALLRRAWTKLPRSKSPGMRAGLFTLALLAAASAAIAVTFLFSTQLLSPGPLFSAIWNCLTAGWVIALCGGAVEAMRGTERALGALEDDLRREVAILNAANRRSQLSLSRLLHGPVQDAIASALRRVEGGISEEALSGLVAELNTTIRDVLSTERSDGDLVDVELALQNVRELWDGVCQIDVHVSESDAAQIRTDPVGAGALVELAREACSNAIRHGNATRCTVEIAIQATDSVIQFAVLNDGVAPRADASPGQGTNLFDELSVHWSRIATSAGTLVTAQIPISRTAGGQESDQVQGIAPAAS